MAIKTLKFYGQGYGTVPCTIVATLNGVEVFSGAVPTVEPQYVDRDPAAQVELFTATIDSATTGTVPMTVEVTAGDGVYAGKILANYAKITNPVYSPAQLAILTDSATSPQDRVAIFETVAVPPFTAEEVTLLESTDPADLAAAIALTESHNVSVLVNGGVDAFSPTSTVDSRANVEIDGEPTEVPARPPYGTYGWFVNNGSTLAYDLVID